MRSALLIALLMVPSLASARTMIIYGKGLNADGVTEEQDARYVAERVKFILDRYGYGASLIDARDTKTDFARKGIQTWNFGTPAAYNETFTGGVIHVGTLDRSAGARVNASYRSDTLTLGDTGSAPTTPQLFLFAAGALSSSSLVSATNCSTGAVAAFQAICHDCEQSDYLPGTADTWMPSGTNTSTLYCQVADARVPGRGLVRLLGAGCNVIGLAQRQGYNKRSGWKDSMFTAPRANPDTTYLWKVNNQHITGASPVIYANAYDLGADAASGTGLSVGIANWPGVMAALAALDSVTNGQVFDPSKLPIQMSIVIQGGAQRNRAYTAGGPDPSDTSFVYTVFDSLDALGIPTAVSVDLDSASARPNDVQRIKDCSTCRVLPFTRAGIDSTAAFGGLGASSWQRPRDPFGRFRNRTFYRTSGTAAGDTAMSNLFESLRFRADSIFGAGKVSPVLLAPLDDYSSYQIRATQNASLIDSVFKAASVAGFVAIIGNVAWPSSFPSWTPTNPRGYGLPHGYRRHGVTLLGHNGFSTLGSSALLGASPDSASPVDPAPGSFHYETQRAWAGALGLTGQNTFSYSTAIGLQAPVLTMNAFYAGEDSIPDAAGVFVVDATTDRTVDFQPGSIVKMHLSDFGAALNAERPGWWTIKSLWNASKAINATAQKNIISIVYPEQIRAPR